MGWNAATSACEKGLSFCLALSAFGGGRQWRHAEQLLSDGEAAKLRLDAISFSAATSACEKGWPECSVRSGLQNSHRFYSFLFYDVLSNGCTYCMKSFKSSSAL